VRSRQLGSLGLAYACGCPETQSMPDCAMTGLDVVRNGTPNGPVPWNNVCRLDAPTSLSVACGSVTPITASLWLDTPAGAVVADGGGKTWVTSNSGVVSVEAITSSTSSGTTPASVSANLRAGPVAGSATVRAWAGGSFVDVPVTVAC
jgi:hypothetical protein